MREINEPRVIRAEEVYSSNAYRGQFLLSLGRNDSRVRCVSQRKISTEGNNALHSFPVSKPPTEGPSTMRSSFARSGIAEKRECNT